MGTMRDVTQHDPRDPSIAEWLVRVLADREPASIPEARLLAKAENARALAALDLSLAPASEVDDETPPDAAGPAIPVRVRRPARVPGSDEVAPGPLPTVVYFHGGG